VVTVATPWRHWLETGDRVVVSGLSGAYDCTFADGEVTGPKQFTYAVPSHDGASTQPTAPEVSRTRIQNASARKRLTEGFDSQFFDILTFRIFKRNSMRYKQPIWNIIKEKAPASMAIRTVRSPAARTWPSFVRLSAGNPHWRG
jgi:hypothetical protein